MDPHCEAFSMEGITIITLSAVGVVVIIITCITCCCLNINSIKVALFMKFNLSFGQRLEIHDRQYDVLILYNQDSDQHFVLDEILPLMYKHQLNPVIEDCFPLGSDRFTCLECAMKQSRSVLVILTRNLLKVNWNLYQLNQAICTQIEQHNFKVVFLVCENPKKFGKLPKRLLLFLRMASAVKKYRRNWKGRLIYELKHKTKRSVSTRLTFGNMEFRRCHLNTINELSTEVGSRFEFGNTNTYVQNSTVWRPSFWQNGLQTIS